METKEQEDIDSSFYRTVAYNKETPFEDDVVPHLPKYLTSFELRNDGTEDILFNDEDNEGKSYDEMEGNDGNECLRCRKPHLNKDGKACELKFCGLSFDDKKFHDGLPVCAFKEALEHFQPGTGAHSFRVLWIDDDYEREKAMKNFNKTAAKAKKAGKAMAYSCYKLDKKIADKTFCHFHDGGSCPEFGEEHLTVYLEELNGECVEIVKNRYFLYVKDLLQRGWSPCCVRFRYSAEPSGFKGDYDRDCWSAVRSIYRYLDCALDYQEASLLTDLIWFLESNNYIPASVEKMTKKDLIANYHCLGKLVENVLDYHEASDILKLREMAIGKAIEKKYL